MPDLADQFGTGAWEFTEDVARGFDPHVRASVPHYDVIQGMVGDLSDWLLPDGGVYADLGSSTGTTAELLLRKHPERDVDVWLYDNSAPMHEQAKSKLGTSGLRHYVERDLDGGPLLHEDADLTTALFTLQFLPALARLRVLQLARDAAADTGAILVAEKVRPVDARWAETAHALSLDWKGHHGIDPEAVLTKERALRGVLRPQAPLEVTEQIRAAGWRSVEVLWRWHSWVLVGGFATGPDW